MRFSGLDLAGNPLSFGTELSCFERENSNLMGPSFNSKRNGGILLSDSGMTNWLLAGAAFSSPDDRLDAEGVLFPEFELSLRTRRAGLLGAVFILGDDRNGATRRRVNFFCFAVLSGVDDVCDASGDGGAGCK